MRRLYAIRDNKAQLISGPLMIHPNDVTAIRQFGQITDHQESDLHKYPDDFELIYVGNIDETTGAINTEHVTTLCTAREWLNLKPTTPPTNGNIPQPSQLDLIK